VNKRKGGHSLQNNIITLTTDFGSRDGYVASLYGLIISRSPATEIVDITHEIAPFNIGQAAFCLFNAHTWFPPGTVHVVVVDPGVGSRREILLINANKQYFIGPDNGVFDPIKLLYDDARVMRIDSAHFAPRTHTFHGRDIFVPAALELLATGSGEAFARPIDYHYRLLDPGLKEEGKAIVLHTDHFGNIITALHEQHIDAASFCGLSFEQISIPFVKFYQEGEKGKPVCLIGSTGLLEVAVNSGSAADYFRQRWQGLPIEFTMFH
jgi:S-adenosylmethionine hydrolase